MPGKRSAGEGYIKRLPSGTWFASVMDGWNDDGTRRRRSFSAPSKAELLDKINTFRLDQKAYLAAEAARKKTFAAWADSWYESYQTQVQPSTYCSYGYTLAILKRYFGDMSISSIKTMQINAFLNELTAKGYSNSQLSKCRSMLIQLFDAAEANDMVVKNYARMAFRGKKVRSLDEAENVKDSFTVEEFHTLMNKLPMDKLGHSIRLMLVTGLRIQELLALQKDDFAEDGSWVSVRQAVKTVGDKPLLGVTKSKRSVRCIPIAPKYRYIALWLRENCGAAFLWCSARDSLLTSVHTWRHKYYVAIEKIPDVRRLSPHCCRHTYVTMLQHQGVPLETIAKLTGHASIRTTGNYLHIGDDTLNDAVAKLGSL